MASMRGVAEDSYNAKLNRMGVKIRTAEMDYDEGKGHANPVPDGSQGTAQGGRATGYASAEDNEKTMSGNAAKPRLDRPGYKKGGRVKSTTVNVIVAPQAAAAPPMPRPPLPMPPPGAAPPMPMPPPGAGMPGAGAMPHANGGRVGYKKGGTVRPKRAYGGGAMTPVAAGGPAAMVGAGRGMTPPAPGMQKAPNALNPPGTLLRGMGVLRNKGGRVPNMDAGAGGAKGRLEKVKAYGDNAKAK